MFPGAVFSAAFLKMRHGFKACLHCSLQQYLVDPHPTETAEKPWEHVTWPTLVKVSKNGEREWDLRLLQRWLQSSSALLGLSSALCFFQAHKCSYALKVQQSQRHFCPLLSLIFLDMLMLLCRQKCSVVICQKQEGEPVSATASGPTARESNSLFIHEWTCCVGNWDILLVMVAGYTAQSNGMGKLWNSFLYDQICLEIRKPNRNQGAQACSQISHFGHYYPLCC